MHRSSESIGTLAAALAKAQAELTNPEKTLTATLVGPGARGGERSFKYAPLSSGLEIVRKSLSRHEIAAVQTTAIDEGASLVRLTTVLAHASGEWIASEWPVCPVSDTASPQRMGAALTYARRYALFTLVGIAGEDDLDAPDLGTAAPASSLPRPEPVRPASANKGNGHKPFYRQPKPTLTPAHSEAQRQTLLAELAATGSIEALTEWATLRMALKNALTADDAATVETAFRRRMEELDADPQAATGPETGAAAPLPFDLQSMPAEAPHSSPPSAHSVTPVPSCEGTQTSHETAVPDSLSAMIVKRRSVCLRRSAEHQDAGRLQTAYSPAVRCIP